MIRVVVTGSECTGKTTLAADLADRLEVPWLPEFAREYVAALSAPPTFADVERIARGQITAEDGARGAVPAGLPTERPLLVQDTDLLSTVVYSHHYYGDCPAWIERELAHRPADLYLLADIDVPWAPDALQRDRGDRREEMQALFHEALRACDLPFIEIRGNRNARLRAGLGAVTALLAAQRADS